MIVMNAAGEKQIVYRLGDTLAVIEEQITELAIENNSGNLTKAARSLGLKRTALTARMRNRYPHLIKRAKTLRLKTKYPDLELIGDNAPRSA